MVVVAYVREFVNEQVHVLADLALGMLCAAAMDGAEVCGIAVDSHLAFLWDLLASGK
jgi:hypothetical protein